MTPAAFAYFARPLFAFRWWFLGLAAFAFVGLGLLLLVSPHSLPFVAVAIGPAVIVPWALLCACTWFHPSRGNLQPTSRLVGRLPTWLQAVLRWYAALFLSLFIIFGAAAWPVLAARWV